MNEKSAEGLFRVLRRPVGTTGGVSNTGFVVSVMAEANPQVIIYHIKNFKSIGRTYTHADVELARVCALYHQRDRGEFHKDPEAVPTVDPKDWPNNLETAEEYIIGF